MSDGHHILISADDRVLVAIDDVQISDNRITLLLGESGIGKSLMSKALYGLLDPDELTVSVDGEDYRTYLARNETQKLLRDSFFVFQEPSSHLNPLMKLRDQIREGGLAQSATEKNILHQLWKNSPQGDIENILDVYPKPYRPSGGEKQRILLTMAFKKIDLLLDIDPDMNNELFVFDEPTGSLDNVYRNLFLEMLFERFTRTNFTCLLITHDYSMIGQIHSVYKKLISKVAFKELTLRSNGLALKDFDPQTYLTWLENQRPATQSLSKGTANLLLKVESRAEIFNRSLIISRKKGGDSPCSMEVSSGEIVYLKAASGVGKTTLVKMLMGLYAADRLDARLSDIHLTERTPIKIWKQKIWGRRMTMVFQHADEALNPESMVRGVFEGLPDLEKQTDAGMLELLKDLFDVGADFLDKKVKHLSGGQKQRLNLLRGFALNTDILILDEPLNGLDFESAGKVIALLQRKQREGKGILLISHNEEIFDRIVAKENIYYLTAEKKPDTVSHQRSLHENR